MQKNDDIRMKIEHRSEPYEICTANEEAEI